MLCKLVCIFIFPSFLALSAAKEDQVLNGSLQPVSQRFQLFPGQNIEAFSKHCKALFQENGYVGVSMRSFDPERNLSFFSSSEPYRQMMKNFGLQFDRVMPSLYEEFLKERLAVEAEMKKFEIGSSEYNFLMQKR